MNSDKTIALTTEAIRIIANAYFDAGCDGDGEEFARYLLARLAHNDPPIIIAYSDELKDSP